MSRSLSDNRLPRRPQQPRGPRRRTGHRRDYDRGTPRRSFHDRLHGSLVDVAVHRVVAIPDLIARQFDDHPYAGRRGVERLKKAGLLAEHRVHQPGGQPLQVLTATKGGRRLAERIAPQLGFTADQRTWAGRGKEADLRHDLAIYRATSAARDQLAAQGFVLRRVRLDPELRRAVLSPSEAARAHGADARAARFAAARALHLPINSDGKVDFPDAQLEYALEPDGPTAGRVNIEVATGHYRAGAIAAKAAAGFAVFAANGRAAAAMTKAGLSLGHSGFGRLAASLTAAGAPGGGGRGGRGPATDLLEL